MPSIKTISASLSTVTMASEVAVDTTIPVVIQLAWADGSAAVGVPASAVVISATGAPNTITQPSGLSDADGFIVGGAFSGGGTGARTFTVTVNGLAMDDQPVVTVGSAATVHFASEWTNSTGITEAAFRDGTTWPALNGTTSNGAAEIVASDAGLTGRGNYFRINNAGTNNLTVRSDTMVPASTTHWGRCYARSQKTTGVHNHWIAIGGLATGGDIEVAWGFEGNASGGSTVRFGGFNQTDGTDMPYPYIRFAPGNVDNAGGYDFLTVGNWYLLEWQVSYLTSTTFHLFVWISEVDATGTITAADKWTASTFWRQDYSGQANTDLATVQAANPYFGLSSGGGPTGARQYVFGNEGPGGGTTDSGYFLTASFGISLSGRLRDSDIIV